MRRSAFGEAPPLRRGFAPSAITGRDDNALESRYHAGIGLRKCIEAARVIFAYDTDRIVIIQSPEVKLGVSVTEAT